MTTKINHLPLLKRGPPQKEYEKLLPFHIHRTTDWLRLERTAGGHLVQPRWSGRDNQALAAQVWLSQNSFATQALKTSGENCTLDFTSYWCLEFVSWVLTNWI